MSDGAATLQRWIDKLNGLAAGELERTAAPEVATELRGEIARNIAAGRAPDGSPWQLTQDGKKPLRNADASLSVTPHGSRIVAMITGPTALHHKGAARGRIVRQVLPSRKSLQPVIAAVRKVVGRVFREHMSG
jgi:hypothetical protein